MSKYTPMIQQYLAIKAQYRDAIVFFRLGDFYEMFFDDAEYAAQALDITLTARDGGKDQKVPMCGVPYHSAGAYIAKLVSLGNKVAICEQVEDPAVSKGLVKREVVRVVTPGTLVESEFLPPEENNYLLAVSGRKDNWAYSYIDVSTGEFYCGGFSGADASAKMGDEILRLAPREMVIGQEFLANKRFQDIVNRLGILTNERVLSPKQARELIYRQFNITTTAGFGIDDYSEEVVAAAMLLDYLHETQKTLLPQITALKVAQSDQYMIVDYITRRNLELTQTIRGGKLKGSLLWLLRDTVTAMGSRLLTKWIHRPLLSVDEINDRLDAVAELVSKPGLLEEVRNTCAKIHDCERILSKAAAGRANARDLVALKVSFEQLPSLRQLLMDCSASLLKQLGRQCDGVCDLTELLTRALMEDPAADLREGNLIKPGYDAQIDRLRSVRKNGRAWIAALEKQERERTGIKSLKVGYNKVFGYYIEITKANLDLVPEDYIRKQTLANSERYITPELKEQEALILSAEERLASREYEVFTGIRNQVVSQASKIQQVAAAVAVVDVLASFARTARKYGYTRPEVNGGWDVIIKDGRHPVVERMLGSSFVPNDTALTKETYVNLITGPNMAGKSTYMRQVALIVLMAQMGCFVPAAEATIGVVDRLFTRVGAADDIFAGQSTFMVEMTEVANICNNATSQSLVILDEIGRGTSTFDGMSIARAVLEYVHSTVGCKTLFATHYHELTELEQELSGVCNLSVAVHEDGQDIVFLRKLIEGPANRSYGIQVAKLAGVPHEVIEKAQKTLRMLQEQTARQEAAATTGRSKQESTQLSIFARPLTLEVTKEILGLDLDRLRPIEALNYLYRLQEKLRN